MARRTIATLKRPDPHDYVEDPEAPGTCKTCHLIEVNKLHDPELVAAWKRDQAYHEQQTHAAQAEARRRIGDPTGD